MARTTEEVRKASENGGDLVEVVPAPEATERPHRQATAEAAGTVVQRSHPGPACGTSNKLGGTTTLSRVPEEGPKTTVNCGSRTRAKGQRRREG